MKRAKAPRAPRGYRRGSPPVQKRDLVWDVKARKWVALDTILWAYFTVGMVRPYFVARPVRRGKGRP